VLSAIVEHLCDSLYRLGGVERPAPHNSADLVPIVLGNHQTAPISAAARLQNVAGSRLLEHASQFSDYLPAARNIPTDERPHRGFRQNSLGRQVCRPEIRPRGEEPPRVFAHRLRLTFC